MGSLLKNWKFREFILAGVKGGTRSPPKIMYHIQNCNWGSKMPKRVYKGVKV